MKDEIRKYIDSRIREILERALEDDPQWDGTDAAHPAYWRGQKSGVRGTVMRINEVLDGKDSGVCNNKELEDLKRRLRKLKLT